MPLPSLSHPVTANAWSGPPLATQELAPPSLGARPKPSSSQRPRSPAADAPAGSRKATAETARRRLEERVIVRSPIWSGARVWRGGLPRCRNITRLRWREEAPVGNPSGRCLPRANWAGGAHGSSPRPGLPLIPEPGGVGPRLARGD
jgi:hypothetical protein